MSGLVLSLFSGLGALDEGFRQEGYCVVSAGDVLWGPGYDIRELHFPSGRFDGVIGGPPCQEWVGLSNLVKLRTGQRSKYGNLIPEFERVVLEAGPSWFVMENVPKAPRPEVHGYVTRAVIVSNRELGQVQERKRRFTFGARWSVYGQEPIVRAFEDSLLSEETAPPEECEPAVTGAHPCRRRPKGGHGETRSLDRMLELQGMEHWKGWLDAAPYLASEKRKLVGNGVPLPMSRAVARAVRKALEGRA